MGNKVKKTVLAALVGSMAIFGGCLGGGGFLGRVLMDAAVYTGLEFVTDNDGIFDLFEDGEPTQDADADE